MGLVLLTERHAQKIAGVLSCYDRVIDEAEYATDLVFRRQADLQAIYGNLIRLQRAVLGKQIVALGLKLKELVIIPEFAAAPCR